MEFVSIDTWTLIFTWANLLILFLIVKHLLYKPVKKILNERREEVDGMYAAADGMETEARHKLEEYTEKVSSARREADGIIKSAVDTAEKKSAGIVGAAKNTAQEQLIKAQEQIESDKLKALQSAREEIADMAVSIAEKILEREITNEDYADLADKFIDEMGDKE